MNKQTSVFIALIAIVLIAVGIYYGFNSKQNNRTTHEAKSNSTQNNESIAKNPVITQQDKTELDSSTQSEQSKNQVGSYQDYSPELVASEQAAGKKVVLFFHAKWCESCKAANTAFMSNTDKIPNNVTILKTDYDTSYDLKTKYGIIYQHTFVQIDSNSNMVTKWSGGDIAALLKNLK